MRLHLVDLDQLALADERAAAGDRDHVAVDLRDRVVDVVHVRLLDLDQDLLALLERQRALLDLLARALGGDLERVERDALGALEVEVLAGLLLELLQRLAAAADQDRRHARVHLHQERLRARLLASLRSRRSTSIAIVSSERTTPSPSQVGQVLFMISRTPSVTFWRVISTSPSGEISTTWVRVRSSSSALRSTLEHLVAVARVRHVDEVDDDDPADVAQPQLAHDLLGRLQVRLRDRVLEASRGRGPCSCRC